MGVTGGNFIIADLVMVILVVFIIDLVIIILVAIFSIVHL
jgi:hypothetical protein